jgi:serine/threonine-protein kinase RsbW
VHDPTARRPLVIGAALIVALAVAGALVAWLGFRNARDDAVDGVRERAVVAAADLDGLVRARLDLVSALAAAPDFKAGDAAAAGQLLTAAGGTMAAGATRDLAWIGPDGRVRAAYSAAGGTQLPTVDLADRDYVRSVLRDGRPYVSEVLVGRVRRLPAVVLAVATRDTGGRINGVLTTSVRLDTSDAAARTIEALEPGLVAIDRTGHVVMRGQPLRGLASVRNAALMRRIRARRSGALAGVAGLDGRGDRVVGFAQARVPDWTVVIDRPASAVTGSAFRRFLAELGLLAAVALIVLIGYVAAVRRMRSAAAAEREARAAAERALDDSAGLREVIGRLGDALTVRAVADVVVDAARRRVRASRGIVAELDDDGRARVLGAEEQEFADLAAAMAAHDLTDGVVIAVTAGDRRTGALVLPPAGALADDERHFLAALAGQCGQALQRARLVEADRTRLSEQRAFLAALQDGFFMCDASLRVVEANDRFCELVGLARAQVIGATPPFAWWPPPGERRRAVDAAMFAITTADGGEFDLELWRSDATAVAVILSVTPVHRDGRRIGYVGTVKDVRDRRLVERERETFVALVEQSTDFIGVSSLQGEMLFVNAAGRRLVGDPDGGARTLADYCTEASWQLFRERGLPAALAHGEWHGEGQLRDRASGEPIDVATTLFVLRDPQSHEPMAYATVQRDIRERVARDRERQALLAAEREARERTVELQELTALLAEARTRDDVTAVIVERAAVPLRAHRVALLLVDGDRLVLAGSRGLTGAAVEQLREFQLDAPLPAALAVRERRPIVVSSAEEGRRRYPALADAWRTNAEAYVALPLLAGDQQPGGVLVLRFRDPRTFTEGDRAFVATIADQCAQALERARLLDVELREHLRIATLGQLSAALDAEHEVGARVTRLLSLIVPQLADWASVELIDPHGTRRAPVVRHRDPTRQGMLATLREKHPLPDSSGWSVRSIAEQDRPILLERLTDAGLGEFGLSPEAVALLEALRPRSLLALPLRAGRQPVGALLLALSSPDRRPYSPRDLPFYGEVARRVALSLRNAQLFEREHEVALELQHALLPPALLPTAELAFAARYLPASAYLSIGGDWYDVVLRPDGGVVLIVGDAVGHGLAAAAAMGHLQSAARAIALTAASPGQLLDQLDGYAERVPGAEYATLCAAFLEPTGGRLRLGSAGHPPPLVVLPDGSGLLLDEARSAPLGGLQSVPRVDQVHALPAGARLLLYTDGLVERRGEPLDQGLRRLMECATARRTLALESFVDALIADLGEPGERRDDIALIAAERSPVPARRRRARIGTPGD